jgi:N-acetylglutamate synthase-like GNAT family acetyltransferase
MPETKLRAMRHMDAWQVCECDATALLKGGGPRLAWTLEDAEHTLRQPRRRNTVAVDCHNRVRGYTVLDTGTARNSTEVMRLVVHADWWGLGVGTQLIQSILIQARDAEIIVVCRVPFCLMPSGAEFLKHHGFVGARFCRESEGREECARMEWTVESAAKGAA